MIDEKVYARLDSKSVADDESGCVLFIGAQARGYGRLKVGGRNVSAHRLACLREHGEPPPGKTHALHTCDVRACVRGDHLYWGDDADNCRDRIAAGTATGGRVYATHCINGHEFTDDNTYREPRGRACKACRRDAVRRYRNRKASA